MTKLDKQYTELNNDGSNFKNNWYFTEIMKSNTYCLIPTIKFWRTDFRNINVMGFISTGIILTFLNFEWGIIINNYKLKDA